MDWLAFAGSIIGGLIGGLFTYMGVKLTLRHEDQKKREVELKKVQDERPRLELVSFKTTKDSKTKKEADLNALFLDIKDVKIDKDKRIRFFYNENCLDSSNLVCIEYVLKNTGKTEIDYITLCSNYPKTTSLIELDNKDVYIKENFLNYAVGSNKRFVKSNDTVSIRIYYHKDEMITGMLSATIALYMRDINGRYWEQALFAPTKELENSRLVSFREYKDNCDTEIAIKCFRGEMHW